MDYIKQYLEKQSSEKFFDTSPHPELFLCLVIPCFNEPDIIRTLQSIWDCQRPSKAVEVIVVINSSENAALDALKQNEKTFREAADWIKNHHDPKLKFLLMLKPNLPQRDAGVGLARKLGMDEAVRRLCENRNEKGIIAGFDADSICDINYLTAIESHFSIQAKTHGASIYFEHPIDGKEFEATIYNRIIEYELHLRYLNQALRFTGHPHAYHTVGSSFAVRVDAYVKQGGMNKRQAGEDFYFLQKIISLGCFTEINTTSVIPSPRESNRVPFGTGAAMRQLMTESKELQTYSLKSYLEIKQLFDHVSELYLANEEKMMMLFDSFSDPVKEFLNQNQFTQELKSIRANVSSLNSFEVRFYKWFNAFRVIKYLNFYHNKFAKENICKAASDLVNLLGLNSTNDPLSLLECYRRMDRNGFGLNRQ